MDSGYFLSKSTGGLQDYGIGDELVGEIKVERKN